MPADLLLLHTTPKVAEESRVTARLRLFGWFTLSTLQHFVYSQSHWVPRCRQSHLLLHWDACSNNGEMGNGWREVEWNSVYANSCHLQERSWTCLETTCDLLFTGGISKGRSPSRRIILILSFSHPNFQSNWKMYLISPSLRE